MSKKDKNTIIKGDGDEGGHLAVLTQYLMIIVPFVCKLVFETVQNLKHLSNDAAQKYAMKSGFWDENEENNFNNCFEYNNKQFQQMNSSNSCNLENDMLNSYLDKILTIGSKVSRNNNFENKNTMNTFEFEAIREIMECLADGRLDIKYLNEHLINQSNVEKFIESWARQLKNDYNTNNEIKFDKNVYENPLLYINGLFSKDYVKQQKFKQSMQVIKRNLSHVKNDAKFKALMNTLISDSKNQTIKNVLKAIQSDKFNILDSIIINKKNKNLKIKSKGEKMKELITKKFKQKIDLKQNELMNLCDEAFKEKSFPFPKFTLQNKKKIITEIPQWEIEELFQKYIQKSGVKVKDNQS